MIGEIWPPHIWGWYCSDFSFFHFCVPSVLGCGWWGGLMVQNFIARKQPQIINRVLIPFGKANTCNWHERHKHGNTFTHRGLLILIFLQVTIKNIERELICPACKELFTHPLILPCQHSICHKCVKELLLTLDDSFIDVGSDNSNQSSPRLRLPSPSMDKIDRLSRPGMWPKPGAWESQRYLWKGHCFCHFAGWSFQVNKLKLVVKEPFPSEVQKWTSPVSGIHLKLNTEPQLCVRALNNGLYFGVCSDPRGPLD